MTSDTSNEPDPPPLLPLPLAAMKCYASNKNPDLMFGWDRDAFKLTIYNGSERQERTFSLDESGWHECWSLIANEYPDFAVRIHERVADSSWANQAVRSLIPSRPRAPDSLFRIESSYLLGGYGFSTQLKYGVQLILDFTTEGLRGTDVGTDDVLLESSYQEAVAMDFSGPGRIETGGGFIGGGFGFTGAIEGMIVASVLNAVTRRSEIQSVIRWEAREMEAFFFTSIYTPSDLRILLSGVLAKIAHLGGKAPILQPQDKLSNIERLASLYKDGLLSEEEFFALKREIIPDQH